MQQERWQFTVTSVKWERKSIPTLFVSERVVGDGRRNDGNRGFHENY